jgi:regulator of RNase E activity RraA
VSSSAGVGSAELEALRAFDTPTICNALEVIDACYRVRGHTREPLICAYPEMGPIVGFARTATIRAAEAPTESKDAVKARRLAYYEYIAHGGPLPAVVVVEDQDGERAGIGAFWGEVNTNIHRNLGCLGVVTNGGVRDLHAVAPGFQFLAARVTPSHAYADILDFGGEINVSGMVARSGDLIHADRHGAVNVPKDKIQEVLKAVALIAKREAAIMEAARKPGFTVDALRKVFAEVEQYH